jgi:drug/metabolite transporter (DMT)-like permease
MSRPLVSEDALEPATALGAAPPEDRASIHRGRLAAATFVVIWCTGYPAGKIAVEHGAPFTILLLRFTFAAMIFGVVALLARATWPGLGALGHSAVVGLLSLALSFGGIYEGLRLGV